MPAITYDPPVEVGDVCEILGRPGQYRVERITNENVELVNTHGSGITEVPLSEAHTRLTIIIQE